VALCGLLYEKNKGLNPLPPLVVTIKLLKRKKKRKLGDGSFFCFVV
jgi:hypothetical protein